MHRFLIPTKLGIAALKKQNSATKKNPNQFYQYVWFFQNNGWNRVNFGMGLHGSFLRAFRIKLHNIQAGLLS